LKIYVGNLSYDTTESQLSELFGQHGEVVSTALITDRDTGRSKGFAFVEAANADAGKAMISAIGGTELDGRTLNVDEAKPKTDNRGGGGGGRGGYGGGGGGGSRY